MSTGASHSQQLASGQFLPWLRYDSQRDVLQIHGRDYSGVMFGEDGFLAPHGTVLRIVDNSGETITVQNAFDLLAHLARQRAFSERTFGPGMRTQGVIDHIRKELLEIEAAPTDLGEWIDVAILALDGAWRTGATPQQIIEALVAKQDKNEARQWPDWRTVPAGQAIEHVRDHSSANASALHTVHCPNGPVHVCANHLHAVRGLLAFMGHHCNVTPAPTGTPCGNCLNEAQLRN